MGHTLSFVTTRLQPALTGAYLAKIIGLVTIACIGHRCMRSPRLKMIVRVTEAKRSSCWCWG